MARNPARSRRRSRSRRKNKRLTRFALITSLCAFFVVFLFLYLFVKQLNQSYISADFPGTQDFRSKDIYTVAFLTSENDFINSPLKVTSIKVLVLSTTSSDFLLFEIPVDLQMEMPGRFGEENLSSIFALGSLGTVGDDGFCSSQCFEEGMTYSIFALERLSGFKMDRWIFAAPETSKLFEDVIISGNILSLLDRNKIADFNSSVRTNLTLADFLHLYSIRRNFRSGDMTELSFTTEEAFDNRIRQSTFNSSVAEEKLSIAVLNAAEIPGAAAFAARVVRNRGGHVVSIDNANAISDQTMIIADDINSDTVAYLSEFFRVSEIISSEDASLLDSVVTRVDVTLVVGLDIIKIY